MNILKPHVSLNVASLESSITFYGRLLRAEVKNHRPAYTLKRRSHAKP